MPYPIIEITQTFELFPPALLSIGGDCPERLWLRGNLELLKAEKSVAIIGARAADAAGCAKAYDLAVDFAQKGYVIVSGLALGCDTAGNDNLLREGVAQLI